MFIAGSRPHESRTGRKCRHEIIYAWVLIDGMVCQSSRRDSVPGKELLVKEAKTYGPVYV